MMQWPFKFMYVCVCVCICMYVALESGVLTACMGKWKDLAIHTYRFACHMYIADMDTTWKT